jgi:sulfur carrier protein ThiS
VNYLKFVCLVLVFVQFSASNVCSQESSYEEFVVHQYDRLGINSNNVYELIAAKIVEDSVRFSENNEYKALLKEYAESKSLSVVRERILSKSFWEKLILNERCDLALLLAVAGDDFSMCHSLRFRKDNRRIRDYIYAPLKADEEPLHREEWEKIIYGACKDELVKNQADMLENKGSETTNPYLYEMWLAKYGTSEEVKCFLLNLPFERGGLLYIKRDLQWPEMLLKSTGIEAENWIEWYIEYVIKPAGLEAQFESHLNEMKDYVVSLESELSSGR